MIRIVGGDLKEFYKRTNTCFGMILPRSSRRIDNIIGVYKGEDVFLCPSPLIERVRGACNKCKYRFECYTEEWGFKD